MEGGWGHEKGKGLALSRSVGRGRLGQGRKAVWGGQRGGDKIWAARYEKGVHPSTAQMMLGHSDIRMTLAVYTHTTDGMHDAAAEALEESL
jgi:integrase